jgi:hypothetical protein
MSISLWLKAESLPANTENYGMVTKKLAANPYNQGYAFYMYGDSGLKYIDFETANSSSNHTPVSYGFSTNTWYQVGVTYKASTGAITYYVNGSRIGSGTTTDTALGTNSDPFEIGAYTDLFQFDGLIKDVRLWSRTLDNIEISDLHSDPCNSENGASLKGWWKFNNNGNDSSGNGNTLTNNNSSSFSSDVPYSCSTVSGSAPSATSTSSFGRIGDLASLACFNTKNINGDDISFYFRGTSIVIEANTCR